MEPAAYLIRDVLIENTFVGFAPDGSHETILSSSGISSVRAIDGVIQDSLIGFQGLNGIHFQTSDVDQDDSVATGWEILRNEISNNGLVNSRFDGIALGNASGTVVRHNLIADNAGFGIDSFFAVGGFEISENTITRNGNGGLETGGIRLFGDNSVVSQNRIVENSGTGISVIGTAQRGSRFTFAGTGNELTQNQFGDNLGIDIDLVSSLTNGKAFSGIVVDGTAVAGLDADADNALSESEIASTGLTLAEHDTDSSGDISRTEYNAAQRQLLAEGDGESAIDGFNQHSGNEGLDQPELVKATIFSDRVELEFDIASGVDRVEIYDVAIVEPDERVTYVTSLLVSNMVFDNSSGTYRIAITPPPPVSGRLTAIAFDGSNTSEFGNRIQLNHVPTAESKMILTDEDTSRPLSQADFGFDDVEDVGDVSKGTILISSVAGGTIELSGDVVSPPTELSRNDLDNLVFIPTDNSENPGAIEFGVFDSEGTTDGVTYTLTVNVTPINDVPTAQSNTVTTDEDTPKPLSQADFGFTDVEDQSDVSKGTINISSIAGGTVTLNGTDVSPPETLSRTDLDNLVFKPTLNSNSPGSIEFEVEDSDNATDGTTYTLTINVTPVNDIPTAQDNTVTTDEDRRLRMSRSRSRLMKTHRRKPLSQADFGFTDDVEDQSR